MMNKLTEADFPERCSACGTPVRTTAEGLRESSYHALVKENYELVDMCRRLQNLMNAALPQFELLEQELKKKTEESARLARELSAQKHVDNY